MHYDKDEAVRSRVTANHNIGLQIIIIMCSYLRQEWSKMTQKVDSKRLHSGLLCPHYIIVRYCVVKLKALEFVIIIHNKLYRVTALPIHTR